MFTVTSNLIDTLATFDTEADALAFVEALGPAFIEADEDHPGCYDAILRGGRIISINKKKVLASV